MALPSLLVGVLVFTTWLPPQPSVAPTSGTLRWVRGLVTGTAPDALTLKLRDKNVTFVLDPSTVSAPIVGSIVEVHYVDRKPTPLVVFVAHTASGAAMELSKRPGRSYRGIVSRTKRGVLSIQVGTKTRGVELHSRTKLMDATGQSIALGSKAVAAQLSGGEEVLVTYDEQSNDTTVNDVFLASSSQRALEIRMLGRSGSVLKGS